MTTPQRDFARQLRWRQTSAEELLWQQFRGRRLGAKFRRQVPLGPFTVDFLCVSAKLVVEVDGTQHAVERDYDERRTREIEAQGLRVIRFTNQQVRERLDDVLSAIGRELRSVDL
jgi:very-short-patch-repair endonuclease